MYGTVLGLGSRHLEGAEKTLGGALMGRRLWMMLRVRKCRWKMEENYH